MSPPKKKGWLNYANDNKRQEMPPDLPSLSGYKSLIIR